MPRPPKVIIHGTALFITTSVESGLLFPAGRVMRAILRSILARAQALHPVRVCHFLVEATHIHMLVVVDNPEDIKGFMERFKTESAHAVNSILGRKKRTVWCEGYDSPVLLTAEDVVRKLIYIYTNPSKDNLVETIEDYPGLSSWNMWRQKKFSFDAPRLHRCDYGCIDAETSPTENEEMGRHVFSLSPDAWMDCFDVPEGEREVINEQILEGIKEAERQFIDERQKTGRGVLGRTRLLSQPINPAYVPERTGRRMLCICSDLVLRKEFILAIKALIALAREVYERWKLGDFSVEYPLGLYPPSLPKRVECVSLAAAW